MAVAKKSPAPKGAAPASTTKPVTGGSSGALSAAENANKELQDFLSRSLNDGARGIRELRAKLNNTYRVLIVLSVVMFAAGLFLFLGGPIYAIVSGNIDQTGVIWGSLGTSGLGLANLISLFLFNPLERIHKLMGDMSQLTLALNSYQNQVGLRLLQSDITSRETIGQAAEHINKAAKDSVEMIQKYFEVVRT